ncbi:NAD(P)/FAD-dependent oxidoreductase [Arenibaculum pallidiluteum]|uniref:NAD(P)/FAD-dependent oxidoreductase n=1 Tax=Arenibaculum pallidiluteum TaxID=2812559 RepID=UPI001A9641C3|nr:FAD-dependent oxidoreductase [Arenibaculum pallidiluteum]
MDQRYDVVIVGGGAIGSAVAYFLAAEKGFGGSVAVIERDPSYAGASSALSASSIRQQFSTPGNIAMSRFGLEFLKSDALALDGETPDLGLREDGYLYLATAAGRGVLERNHAVQRAAGADVALLEPAALADRFPWISTEGVALASLGLSGEGWFDGYGLLQAFRRKARALGVDYLTAEAVGIERERGRVAAVRLADGRRIGCGTLVNAAGPHARAVAAMAGLELPVAPRRRSVFVFECRDALPGCPLVIDTSGVWFRPEGTRFICGTSPAEGEPDPDTTDLTVEHQQFEEVLWPALAARVPAFEAVRQSGAWAGLYEMNTFDHNAVLGPHPELPNFLFANGFSGHGLQQSPAAGRAIAELVAFGAYRTLDLREFGWERLRENRPILELNVI